MLYVKFEIFLEGNYLIFLVFLALLDIPVYESRIQSLHALFTLYLGFKNSEVKKKVFIEIFIFYCFCSILKR
jgi:hypothetical protein